ncbi:MAG: ATP-binding cassette domain-containing protein [Candidatus Bilamarchaeaceae archaeon]
MGDRPGCADVQGGASQYAIKTEGLIKRFGQLTAVDDVSLQVGKGEIFGLLGPNGAGKTTFISMLVTTKRPSEGKAYVNGFDISAGPHEVRKSIGIVFQDPSLDEELTAYENMELHAAMYGVTKSERKKRIIEGAEAVGLSDRINDIVKTYSGGMRRRLEIARALLHHPQVLFLDEPTIGLDPQTRQHVWDSIRKMREKHGVTILITTHYMDEADSLCDRIGIMDKGRIIALDTGARLKDALGGDTVEVVSSDSEALEKALGKQPWVKSVKPRNGGILLQVESAETKIPKIMSEADRLGVSVSSINMRKPTLEDVFLHYTGRSIREEEAHGDEAIKMHVRARRRP